MRTPKVNKPYVIKVANLTKKEVVILKLIAKGWEDVDIAAHVNIALKTCQTHIGHIYKKLEAHNRAQAIVFGVRKGIVSMEDILKDE